MERSFADMGTSRESRGASERAPESSGPRLFTFLRDSVGAGEIKGERERWVAPAALYTGFAGIQESSWTITTETVVALRLHGAVVEDHNRRVKRVSGPSRDLALQPKGTPTHFLSFGTLRFGHVFLQDSLLDRASDADSLPPFSGRLRDDFSFVPAKGLETLVGNYLKRAFDPVNPATSLEMEGRALLLVDHLRRLHEPLRIDSTARTGGLSPRHLRRVCDFIMEHLADDLRLDDLAELTGLSCKHFVRAFKQATGLPPHQYLIRQRVEAAKRLLLDTKVSLADIALKCGFTDQSHFTAAFRKVVGVPPGAWRWNQGM